MSFLRTYFTPFVLQNEKLSLLQIFKPVYYLLSAIGLFPSSITFPSGNMDFKVVLKSSTINLACTLLMTITICVFFGLHMSELSVADSDNSFSDGQITLTNYNIDLILLLLVSLVAYICALKNRSLYIKILNEIAGCWADLPNNASDGILGPLRVQVNCVVLGSLLWMLIMQLLVTLTEDNPNYIKVLVAMTFNLPEMIQFTLLAFYCVMMVMIVAILKNIEERFAMIIYMKRVRTGENSVGLTLGLSLASLRQLRGVYARALAVKRQVNAAFQAPLLFILAQSFHTLVSVAHGLYHGVTYQNNFTVHDIVEECFWVFYQLIKFHTLGYSSALLKLQTNKIGCALHNITARINQGITKHASSAGPSEEIKLHLEVQHFASMMKFQETEITIYGLFPLKSSLLFNVVATAVTYLVILVQFDEDE